MITSSARFYRSISRLLMLTMVVWLAGVDCANCKAVAATTEQAAAAQSHGTEASGIENADHCASSGHCQRPARLDGLPSAASSCHGGAPSAGPMPCCSLSSQSFDSARKSSPVQERFAPSAGGSDWSGRWTQEQTAVLRARPTPGDGGETYLRGCAFLI